MNKKARKELVERLASQLEEMVLDELCDMLNMEEGVARLEDPDDAIGIHDDVVEALAEKLNA